MEGKAWHISFVRMLKDLLPENHLPKKEDIVTVLSKRCTMPSEVATELAMKIISDLRWRLTRYAVPHTIFHSVMTIMGSMSTKNIVVCGTTGVGKSSVNNLMAGH